MGTTTPWYNRTTYVLAIASSFGILGWMLYTSALAFFSPTTPFLQLIVTSFSLQDLILRLIVSGCFFLFGILVINSVADQRTKEKKLRDNNAALQQQNTALQQKVQDKTREVELLLKQKNDLLVGLSHDLNTPLTPLMGFLPMIIKEETNPKLKELLTLSLRNVHYIRDLVSKTIDLSLLDSTVIGLTLEKTNLGTEVETVLENRSLILHDHHLFVDNHIDEHLFVHADKLKLREVLNNLVMNSIIYSPSSGGLITLNAQQKYDEIVISITDTGVGLTPEQLTSIFDELYKGDLARQDHKKTGLGLPICKRIVEKHGGKIWAKSPGPGKGTTVFFTLPAEHKQ